MPESVSDERSGRMARTLDSVDLTVRPSFARAGFGIGCAPGDRRLIPKFTIKDNIILLAIALKFSASEIKCRMDEIYGLLPEIETMRKRPGGGVSGGQGKMVALGRALMVSEKVIMLDEPFQGLAPALALDYARTLGRLRELKPGLAIFITESSPQLLKNVTDVMLRIERGIITTDV